MNKDNLQKELLAKIKLGTKPSDLKKQTKNSLLTPPDSPIIVPVDKKPKQKPEPENLLTSPTVQNKQVKQLQAQVNFHAQTSQAYLANLQAAMARMTNLEEEIKELQTQNQTLNKTIQAQEKHPKPTENIKQAEPQPTTFTCSSCSHTFNIELIRLAKKSGKKICRNCTLIMLKRANQLSGQRIVLKKKNPETNPQTKIFSCQTCQQINEGEPHQVHITNYQEQGINPRQLTNICSPCLQEKVVLANFYCPRTSEGRDTYNPHEAQFDCDCPQGGKS